MRQIEIKIVADTMEDALAQMRVAARQIEQTVTGIAQVVVPERTVDGAPVGVVATTDSVAGVAEPPKAEEPKADAAKATRKPRAPKADATPDVPATNAEQADVPKTDAPPTLERVREVLGALQTHHPDKTGAVVDIVKRIGKAPRVSEADASTYAAMIAEAQGWLKANGHAA